MNEVTKFNFERGFGLKQQKEFRENTLKSIGSYFEDWNLDQINVKRVFDEKK